MCIKCSIGLRATVSAAARCYACFITFQAADIFAQLEAGNLDRNSRPDSKRSSTSKCEVSDCGYQQNMAGLISK